MPPIRKRPVPKTTISRSTNEVTTYDCQTTVKLEKIRYVWKIDHFQLFYDHQFKSSDSPGFKSKPEEHIEWKLRLLTHSGDAIGNKDHIGLFLFLSSGLNETNCVCCKFKISILNANQDERITFSANHKFTEDKDDWGWKKALKRDFLFDEDNYLLPNDVLTITCDLEYLSSANVVHTITKSFDSVIDIPECNISEDLKNLWLNESLSDVTLSVNGKDFPVHKVILTARSSVFAAMFKHKMKERRSSRVEISDINEIVFEELLRYIYTGKVDNLKTVALDLLAAANKYDLERLKMICEAELCKQLKVENAVEILMLADMHNSNQLKKRAIDFIKTCLSDVINTNTWKVMISNHADLINDVCCAFATTKE